MSVEASVLEIQSMSLKELKARVVEKKIEGKELTIRPKAHTGVIRQEIAQAANLTEG